MYVFVIADKLNQLHSIQTQTLATGHKYTHADIQVRSSVTGRSQRRSLCSWRRRGAEVSGVTHQETGRGPTSTLRGPSRGRSGALPRVRGPTCQRFRTCTRKKKIFHQPLKHTKQEVESQEVNQEVPSARSQELQIK